MKCPKCHFEIRKSGECLCTDKASGDASLNFINDFHDSYYDYGLGQVIRTRQERKRIMKEKGLIEVGNERDAVDPAKAERQRERVVNKALENINTRAYQELSQWN